MKYKRGSINQVHINSKDTRCNKLSIRNLNSASQEKQKNTKMDSYMKSLQLGEQTDNLQESHIISSRTLKRGSPYLSQDEVNIGTPLKFKISQKEGKRLRVISTSHENLDADVAKEDRSSAYRKEASDDHDDDDGSVTCSVGSCSINSHNNFSIHSKSIDFKDVESYSSDAESVCEGRYEDEIHRLELQAYRRTIEALHASGPLTWEKETMAQSWMLVHLAYESVS